MSTKLPQHHGVYTALVTPFRDGRLDSDAYAALIEKQIQAGVAGIVAVGTTGESATLSTRDHIAAIRLAVMCAQGRVEVLAGTGANSTEEAIDLTQAAESAGATGSLQVTPYYNKPNQEGIFQHFKAIASQTSLPIMLYSVPGRCVVEIAPETAARLADACPNIVSIKEASGRPERATQLAAALPSGFPILSGDDPLVLEFVERGAVGLVSVASNVIPEVMVKLFAAAVEGRLDEAHSLNQQYAPIIQGLMALDTNPIPVKAALAALGQINPEIRLPLVPLSDEKQVELHQILKSCGLLS